MSGIPDDRTKILVVDDRIENLVAMEAILADIDVNVFTALSGHDALRQMINNDFALILLDVQMPDMDGFETAELIRGNEKTRSIPIIFLTALNKEDKHIEKGYYSGAVDYILKPVNPVILRHKVTIFKTIYEQSKTIRYQSQKLMDANVELQKLYEIEHQAANAKDALLIEQSKLAIMGEMIGFMAHQWKQPLNILSLCLGTINDTIKDHSFEDEDLVKAINYGIDQLKYMAETIDDFRIYTKPDRCLSSFDVNDAILDVMKLIGEYVTKNGITLEFRCGMDMEDNESGKSVRKNILWKCRDQSFECERCYGSKEWMIYGSPNEFKQVVINLVNNARDAIDMREYGDRSFADDVIVISTFHVDGIIKTRVSDTAGGIPESIFENIFQPYFTTKKDAGTGIGLSMVKTIVEDHFHGSLDVRNNDKGAEFTINIAKKIIEAD